MFLPEEIRNLVVDRLESESTKHAEIRRSVFSNTADSYPLYILEYGQNQNLWNANKSDVKQFVFNLYITYGHDNTEEQVELAELAISECIGELYRNVFGDPNCLGIPNGWLRASQVTWGYGDTGATGVPTRMAMLQLEVTVHEDR